MSSNNLRELRIGDLTAKIPIIQGGMGVGISLSGMASAVANEGGIGVISAAVIDMLDMVRTSIESGVIKEMSLFEERYNKPIPVIAAV